MDQEQEQENELSASASASDDESITYHCGPRTPYGYRDPVVDCHYLSPTTLLQLSHSNPDVAGLNLHARDWIQGAGRAIGESTVLQFVHISFRGEWENEWVIEFFQGLSLNQTIELFSLCSYSSVWDLNQILTPFLKNNHNLRCLELTNIRTPNALSSLVSALSQCQHLQLEKIIAQDITGTDVQHADFVDFLNGHIGSLLELCLYDNQYGILGCTSLAKLLNNPASKIENLKLGNNNLDHDCTAILRDALSTASTLKELLMWGPDLFQSDVSGRNTFLPFLSYPMCKLEHLSIGWDSLGDAGLQCLGNALADNKSLKFLRIDKDVSMTSAGWHGFSRCLRNPDTVLEALDIRGCKIDGEGAVSIFSALTENATLQELQMFLFHVIAGRAYNVLSNVLLDKSCIDNTFNSNHTLCELPLFPEKIRQILKMNRNESKVEVARKKIMEYHFPEGNRNIHQVFARMPETSLPFAIEWIGRNRDGRTLMYNFAQEFPTLFDKRSTTNVNKRKHQMIC